MSNNPLDLGQLTMDEFDFEGMLPKIEAKREKIEKECKEKYGDDWWEHYVRLTNPDSGKDSYEEIINDAIYRGTEPTLMGSPEIMVKSHYRYEEKMKRLFGIFWKRHIKHQKNDPKINKLLIKDALRTGKWRELPKELHEEYHRQAERMKNNDR